MNLIVAAFALTAQLPVDRVWIRAAADLPPAARRIAPDVHRVRIDEHFVEVESAGFSLQSFGPLEAAPLSDSQGARRFHFRIPRQPKPAATPVATPAGVIGVFVNGVPIYNPSGLASYRDQNLWRRDPVAQSSAIPALLRALLERRERHSPLIGFALDGYPIYGPHGWDAARTVRGFRSSYRLRTIKLRRTLADGTALPPGQEGPPVSARFPLGTFTADYEYVEGSGDLDRHNGRHTVTPEYPQGTYAYFLATNTAGNLAYPYLLGPTYRGVREAPTEARHPIGADRGLALEASTLDPRAGETVEWVFTANATMLERVHEKTLHLLVISEDLSSFDHVHPEPLTDNRLLLRYRFAMPGRYRLYADYTPAGGTQTIARFPVTVAGVSAPRVAPRESREAQAAGLRAVIRMADTPRAGRDLRLQFAITNAATGAPIGDLRPYLGAWAHILMLGEDGEDLVHSHPKEDDPPQTEDPWQHSHANRMGLSPSVIESSAGFRRAGVYKIWLQVQRNGEVVTFPFVVGVHAGDPPKAAEPAPADSIRITVDSQGYTPARITVAAGKPVQLAFHRTGAQNCGSRVVFPSLRIERALAPGAVTLIDLPAMPHESEIRFACGMGMYRGAAVALRDEVGLLR